MRNPFYDKSNTYAFTSMTQARAVIALVLAALAFIGALTVLVVYAPQISGFIMLGVAAVTAITIFVLATKVLLRNEPVSQRAADTEMRDNLAAERQKQVDAMRRANSNIPEVKRRDR